MAIRSLGCYLNYYEHTLVNYSQLHIIICICDIHSCENVDHQLFYGTPPTDDMTPPPRTMCISCTAELIPVIHTSTATTTET